MFSPFPVRHRSKLSNSKGHGPSAPALHKRLTKRLFQFCRHKGNKPDAKMAAKHTASTNGGVGVSTYRALSLVIKPGYPVDSVPAQATLHIQQNVVNTHSGHLEGSGPTLRIGPFPLLDRVPKKLGFPMNDTGDRHRGAARGPSRQKRPPRNPGKSGSNSKKPRKENTQGEDKARNGADGDGGKAQSDRGSDDDDDDDDEDIEDGENDENVEDDSSRDGPRYPQPEDSPNHRTIGCPFYKYDPARYYKCKGHHITTISYATQHISRRHVLKQRTLGVQRTGKDKNPDLTKTKSPKNIVFYCPTCRDEFHGPRADIRYEHHLACEAKTIAQTGVLLPEELVRLKREVTATTGENNKWEKIWTTLFSGTSTAIQYSDAETVAPIGVDVQPHNSDNTIPHHLSAGAVNETHHHDPPQVYDPQVPSHMQLPNYWWDENEVLYVFQDGHWNMVNNIENPDNNPSHIPNLAPTHETTMGPGQSNPDFSQNPSFSSNAWPQNNYYGTE